MPFVSLADVNKRYDTGEAAVAVLHDIDLQIGLGEFVAMMGPSGSGKSTLLTILGAMNRPSSGSVAIDGIDIYGLSEERRADFRREYIGFVFQQHHLMPFLNAIENVCLPLAATRLPAAGKLERGHEALEWVGLSDKAERLPGQLSGGEQGRLAIARALVNQPGVILADEPTGALDSKTGSDVMELFIRLKNSGKTVFMVTHNRENAAMADRILQLRDGRLLVDGSPRGPLFEEGLPEAKTCSQLGV